MEDEQKKKSWTGALVIGYPIALIAIAVFVNAVFFGVDPLVMALPTSGAIVSLTISALLLLANHT